MFLCQLQNQRFFAKVTSPRKIFVTIELSTTAIGLACGCTSFLVDKATLLSIEFIPFSVYNAVCTRRRNKQTNFQKDGRISHIWPSWGSEALPPGSNALSLKSNRTSFSEPLPYIESSKTASVQWGKGIKILFRNDLSFQSFFFSIQFICLKTRTSTKPYEATWQSYSR